MNKNKLGSSIIALVMLALLATSMPATAQTTEMNNRLSDTKEDVTRLLEVKDDTQLTASEKERKEMELKVSILLNVIELSQAQLSDIKAKLDKLSLPETDEWKALKTKLTETVGSYLAYYEEVRTELKAEDLTMEKITSIAKALGEKKTGTIDPTITRINNVILSFNVDAILNLAQQRLEKIKTDIEKIYTRKLTKANDLNEMFDQASQTIKNAQEINGGIQNLMLTFYTDETSTSTRDLIKELKSTINKEAPLTTSTTSPSPALNNEPDPESMPSAAQVERYIQKTILKSLGEVRKAYDLFLKMSIKAKDYFKQ